ncbi:host cell division inhibitor Icd-like protein [Xenorhabdus szentirmaii]|uniref:host cell division inhibitor Icd-like protein n=1 Tax=Xenorhabdus szentirmaii TaxID=290112 RepID=UPI00198957CC|nr:host cell division inhibitor Icd-like protein [Xenorhabdus sp. 38]MBD2780817.1 host cell division inhibitor Icd-like protein [Xenorhabdus sp. 38]
MIKNDHFAPPCPKSYKFLLYAHLRANKKSKPERVTIKAGSLKEARLILAPHYVLSYAGCVPVQHGA